MPGVFARSALATALAAILCAGVLPAKAAPPRAVKVEFTATPAPHSDDERLSHYTKSVARVSLANGLACFGVETAQACAARAGKRRSSATLHEADDNFTAGVREPHAPDEG